MQITGTTVTVIGTPVQPNSQPPSVSMLTPPGTLSGTEVFLSADATDPSGITSVQFLLDGFPIGPAVTTAPYTLSWNSRTTSNGTHYLSAHARAGTTFYGSAPAVLVTVANSGPPPPPPPGAPVVDKVVTVNATGTANTPSFSSAAAGELLLAFVSADGPAGQTATVTGAGLAWTLVKRANSRPGTAESPRASSQLTNVTVRSTLGSDTFPQSLAVVAFRNGGGAGASSAAGAIDGAPTVSLTTTHPDSRVYGVGVDTDSGVARGLATGQTMVHQWVNTGAAATFWVEALSFTVPAAGTYVLRARRQLSDGKSVEFCRSGGRARRGNLQSDCPGSDAIIGEGRLDHQCAGVEPGPVWDDAKLRKPGGGFDARDNPSGHVDRSSTSDDLPLSDQQPGRNRAERYNGGFHFRHAGNLGHRLHHRVACEWRRRHRYGDGDGWCVQHHLVAGVQFLLNNGNLGPKPRAPRQACHGIPRRYGTAITCFRQSRAIRSRQYRRCLTGDRHSQQLEQSGQRHDTTQRRRASRRQFWL